jgi:LacI family transcriptional regulator
VKAQPYRIAVILPVESEYSNRLLEGVIEYAEGRTDLALIQLPYLRSGPSPLPVPPFPFEGALTHLSVRDRWAEELLAAEIPVVNTSGEWWDRGPVSVAFDGGLLIQTAVEYLVSLGRGHLGYVGEASTESVSLSAQVEHFLREVESAGLAVSAHEIGRVAVIENRLSHLPADAAGALQAYLKGLPKPAAVYCEDDFVARVTCDEAASAGIEVPDELAVLGLGDYSVARLGNPPISSIPQPGKLVGYRALELLHHILDGSEARFHRIRKWIHEHACEGLTVNDLVRSLPMSQFTFSKHFARLYGCTPGEEIRKVKTERAKHYLRSTTLSVERIAGLCGFEQQGKFSKFFKRQTGMTPSEYRTGGNDPAG